MRNPSQSNTLVLCPDFGPEIGAGHLMRCIALAQAWQRELSGESRVIFALKESAVDFFKRKIEGDPFYSFRCVERAAESDVATILGVVPDPGKCWFVLDGYRFGLAYQSRIKAAAAGLLVVDDFCQIGSYAADLLLDQNSDLQRGVYRRSLDDSALLLGPRYVLLRDEFFRFRRQRSSISSKNLLIVMGGTDSQKRGLFFLDSIIPLIKEFSLQVTVVQGDGADKMDRSAYPSLPIQILNLENQMAERMSQADIAISSAGSTGWELAFMGVPAILTSLAPNQIKLAELGAAHGFALNLGPIQTANPIDICSLLRSLLSDPGKCMKMSRQGQDVVDGQGAERVVKAMLTQRKNP